jgi:hypothetical protein
MMAKPPAARPQSMTAVIGLLERCRSSAVIKPEERRPSGRGLRGA